MIDRLRPLMEQHRQCGVPRFDGCFSHLPLPHCRADGAPWPCDVDGIRRVLTEERTEVVHVLERAKVVHVFVPDHYEDEPCTARPEDRTRFCHD